MVEADHIEEEAGSGEASGDKKIRCNNHRRGVKGWGGSVLHVPLDAKAQEMNIREWGTS